MNSIGEQTKPRVKSDWQTYLDLLSDDSRIKSSVHPHYGRWASHWLKAGGSDSEEATKRFFEELGRRKDLKDWQKGRGIGVLLDGAKRSLKGEVAVGAAESIYTGSQCD